MDWITNCSWTLFWLLDSDLWTMQKIFLKLDCVAHHYRYRDVPVEGIINELKLQHIQLIRDLGISPSSANSSSDRNFSRSCDAQYISASASKSGKNHKLLGRRIRSFAHDYYSPLARILRLSIANSSELHPYGAKLGLTKTLTVYSGPSNPQFFKFHMFKPKLITIIKITLSFITTIYWSCTGDYIHRAPSKLTGTVPDMVVGETLSNCITLSKLVVPHQTCIASDKIDAIIMDWVIYWHGVKS